MNPKTKENRFYRTKPEIQTMVYGKVPPQATELESAVLGQILVDRDAFDTVSHIIKPEVFYQENHQRIYSAMAELSKKHSPIDIHTVTDQLMTSEELEMVGGPYYVSGLTNSVVNAANIEHHCKILLQKFIARELIRVCGQAVHDAYQDSSDVFELLEEVEGNLMEVSECLSFGDMVPIDNVIVQAIQKIEEWRKLETPLTGIPSGFKDIDAATRGWQNGDLIILAARPSVGKTALMLNLIRNAAMQGYPVAVWSLEMKAIMLVLRMFAAESKQNLHRIQTGRMTDEMMQHLFETAIKRLSKLKIFFDDRSGLNIQKLKAKCRKMKKKGLLKAVFLDYLQLMTPSSNATREQQISEISRELKTLAQELDVPIIALSQLNRDLEKRTGHNRKPQLSDLRESGSLEQDADVVMFLWGPDDQEILNDASLLNRRYLRIAKQRNGMLTKIDLDFEDEIQLFNHIEAMSNIGLPANWKPVPEALKIDFGKAKDKEEEPL